MPTLAVLLLLQPQVDMILHSAFEFCKLKPQGRVQYTWEPSSSIKSMCTCYNASSAKQDNY